MNYKIERHPEKWEAFKTYTHNQIGELMSNYGTIDILWLDGGWVSPRNNQDIDMPQIAAMARAKQPGLLVVDRLFMVNMRTIRHRNKKFLSISFPIHGKVV